MMFVIRQLNELARKKRIPLYLHFIHLTKAYGFVDRTLPWTALARFDVSQNNISIICQFHVRLDDRVYSEGFVVEQGLRHVCVPLLFNILFAAVINVAYTRFKVDTDIMGALVHLKKNKAAVGRGKATAGEPALTTTLWGVINADNTGVVSQPPEQLRKMMVAIMVVSAAFDLIVLEAKTETMY